MVFRNTSVIKITLCSLRGYLAAVLNILLFSKSVHLITDSHVTVTIYFASVANAFPDVIARMTSYSLPHVIKKWATFNAFIYIAVTIDIYKCRYKGLTLIACTTMREREDVICTLALMSDFAQIPVHMAQPGRLLGCIRHYLSFNLDTVPWLVAFISSYRPVKLRKSVW